MIVRTSGNQSFAVSETFRPSFEKADQAPSPRLEFRFAVRFSCEVVGFVGVGRQVEEVLDARLGVPDILMGLSLIHI